MNNLDILHQKETALLEYISRYPKASQRAIAISMGMSLGQINSIINRLIEIGDIEIVKRNGRQTEYLVTSHGHARRVKSSAIMLSEAFHRICDAKRTIARLLDEFVKDGVKEFILEGDEGPLSAIVGEVFREVLGERAKLIWGPAEPQKNQIILKLDGTDAVPQKGVVYILHELANS